MINIYNLQTIEGSRCDLHLETNESREIDGNHLTLFPALIDPHVHFRTPGLEHKENWGTAAKASICGGYTTVMDMPNTLPPVVTKQILNEKKALIDAQLKGVGIPLRYHLYFGADKNHFNELNQVKHDISGIKVFMGCSTGNLVIDDDSALHALFAVASSQSILILVHAEDEALMKEKKALYSGHQEYAIHSRIRDREVAVRAVEKAIDLAALYKARVYFTHISTSDEIQLIKRAKQAGLAVYAETTPHHLFLNESAYQKWGGKVVMNPPLRTPQDQEALFTAIQEGVIDTIGSDHAPHTSEEKMQPYGICPSGVPGMETTLPLLLNAYHQGKLTLRQIVNLTSCRPREIFNLPSHQDVTLVDLAKEKIVADKYLRTKCGWSPFSGMSLKGWPVYTILGSNIFDLSLV